MRAALLLGPNNRKCIYYPNRIQYFMAKYLLGLPVIKEPEEKKVEDTKKPHEATFFWDF